MTKIFCLIFLVGMSMGCVTGTTVRTDPNTGVVTETKTEFSLGLLSGPVLIVPSYGYGYPYSYPVYPFGFGYYYNVNPYLYGHGHRHR